MRADPVGAYLRAVDGGMSVPLGRAAADYIRAQAEPAAGSGGMEVKGVGYRYGIVGWFGLYGAIRIEAGAFIKAPGRHRRGTSKYRDAMGLYAHDTAAVLARAGNNTLDIAFVDAGVDYAMRLNKEDSMARDVWARCKRGEVNASSIGFVILEGDWTEGQDNSLDADPETAGEPIEIYSVTSADLVEISLVAQGAYAGATAYPADSKSDAIVGGDGTEAAPAEAAAAQPGASARPVGGAPVAGDGGGYPGGTESDGKRGGRSGEAARDAETMTIRAAIEALPYQARRELANADH